MNDQRCVSVGEAGPFRAVGGVGGRDFIHQHGSMDGSGACGAAVQDADATDVTSADPATEAL
jgi:hypothetical protein